MDLNFGNSVTHEFIRKIDYSRRKLYFRVTTQLSCQLNIKLRNQLYDHVFLEVIHS